jgi:hypothetical protein
MSTFLDIASPLAERGFRVFPLVPENKMPVRLSWGDHFDAATTDISALKQWGQEVPRANVGLSPDENFCFLETDDEAALHAACSDISSEVWDTARVSARDNRCYYIFRQTMRTRKTGNMTVTREGQENLFEFKQHRVYVTGPGSIHPKTGKAYGVDWRIIPAMPDILLNRLCELYGAPKATGSGTMDAETQRQTKLLESFLETYEVPTDGDWFNKGKQWFLAIECPWASLHENTNAGASTCIVYNEGGGYGYDCKHRCANKGWKEFRAAVQGKFPGRLFSFVNDAPGVVIGTSPAAPVAPKDWRAKYHTFDEVNDAPEPTFLIEGFLQKDIVTALAAPVGQRKSIIALNIIHACCTKEALFDHFAVTEKPTRIIYLVPEMGLLAVAKRVRAVALLPYVGKTLFIRTMNSEGTLSLGELTPEEVCGALVVIDTAARFIQGDENTSEHAKVFSEDCFRLMKMKPAAVLVLYHSGKETKVASELTLENAMRGSGELGAAVSTCWATRLQDPDPAVSWTTPSYLTNVKQRDFESKPFEAKSGPDYRMHIVDVPGSHVVLSGKQAGTQPNADGNEAAAEQVIRDNPALSLRALEAKLKELGIKRKKSWIGNKRFEIHKTGVKTA